MKKIISVVLVLIMAVGLLTGCGATMDQINENTNIVVATIGDQDIYAYELIYLMKMGATKEEALNEVQIIKTFLEKAKEHNITLTEEEIASIDQQWTDTVAQFENEEAFIKELENYGVTKEQYKAILEMLTLYDKFGSQIETLNLIEPTTEEAAISFYNNNFLRAKHILFTTVDEAGQPLGEDEIKAKKALAEDTLAKIKAGAAFEDFADLSEDPGSEASPDGYVFINTKADSVKDSDMLLGMFQQSGVAMMVEPFEQGTAALEVDQVSEIVESDYGFHIIKRLALPVEGEEFEQTRFNIARVIDSMAYNTIIEGWRAELKQKTNKYYEVLEVEPATPAGEQVAAE